MGCPGVLTVLCLTTAWIIQAPVCGRPWPASSSCQPCSCSVITETPLLPNKRRLKVANCSDSNLQEIPSTLPDNLDLLDLSFNNIHNVSGLVLERYKYLLALVLDGNRLKSLSEEGLPVGSRLQVLSLAGNRFDTVDGASFSRLLHMTTLSGLEADVLVPGVFSNLANLRVVSLRTSGDVPTGLLDQVSIYSLTLYLEEATTVPADIFRISSKTLRDFNVIGRKLEYLPSNMLHNLTSLREVSIQVEGLDTFPAGFFGSDDPDTGTSYCYITKLSVTGVRRFTKNLFCDRPDLQKLSIEHTLHISDQAFSTLIRLHTLQLRHNNLTEINTAWFQQITGLKHLDLSWNNFTRISRQNWSELRALEVLNVSDNNIREITGDAFETYRKTLITLRLKRNHICNLPPQIFTEMFSLEFLDLSFNCLETLSSELFQDLWRLTRLELQVNRLATIDPNTFDVLVSLQFLNGSSNALTTLEDNALFELSALRILDISDNQISVIPVDLVNSDAGLKYVNLRQRNGTAFLCNCALRSFLSSPSNWQVAVVGTCSLPEGLKDREIASLDISEVCEDEETTTVPPTTMKAHVFTSGPNTPSDIRSTVHDHESQSTEAGSGLSLTSIRDDITIIAAQVTKTSENSEKHTHGHDQHMLQPKTRSPVREKEIQDNKQRFRSTTTAPPLTASTLFKVHFRDSTPIKTIFVKNALLEARARENMSGNFPISIAKSVLIMATVCVFFVVIIGVLFFIRRLRGHLYKRSYYVNYDVH